MPPSGGQEAASLRPLSCVPYQRFSLEPQRDNDGDAHCHRHRARIRGTYFRPREHPTRSFRHDLHDDAPIHRAPLQAHGAFPQQVRKRESNGRTKASRAVPSDVRNFRQTFHHSATFSMMLRKSSGTGIGRKALTFDRPVLPIGMRPVSEPSGASARRTICPMISRVSRSKIANVSISQ